MSVTLTESVNPKRCLTLLNMTKNEIKDIFWNPEECCGDFNWTAYLNAVKMYLRKGSASGGQMQQTYNFAKNQSDGRLYVANGCGLQMLQSKIVRYLAGEYYYDVDLVNCHPSIILHLCDKYKIPSIHLREYVTNRSDVLKNHDLTKFDILVAINRDNNKKKRYNDWYNCFIAEMSIIKDKILEQVPDMVTTNEKNPISSKVNHHVLSYENKIIQQAVEYFNPDNVGVLMFDGLMIHKCFCDPDKLDKHISALNDMFHEEYGGLVTFVPKPMTCDVNIEETKHEIESYESVKKRFEEDHFLTLQPYAYWKRTKNTKGFLQYNQIAVCDFKNMCEEYRVIDFDEKGMMKNASIFNKWIQDTDKRQYQCADFLPYTKTDIAPPHVFNTFTGYAVDQNKGCYESVSTDNFDKLLMNLADGNKEMFEYLWKYTCKMIQKPTELARVFIVFKGLEGSGKDSYFSAIHKIIGQQHYSTVDNMDSLFGNYNSILKDKICLSINEMTGRQGIDYEEDLKRQATNADNYINAKYEKPFYQTNSCHIFVNSNHDAPVNLSVTDRRGVVCKTGVGLVAKTKNEQKRKENIAFWNQFYQDIDNISWQKSLYQRFLDEDVSDFQADRDAPKTEELQLMKSKNIQPIDTYMKELIDNKRYDGFMEVTIKKQKKHIIKFKTFANNYKKWLADNVSCDYIDKIKDTQIKQKLKNMNDGFIASRDVRYTEQENNKSKVEKFSIFDFAIMGDYLDSYIFNDIEHETIDVGCIQLPKQPLKPNYGLMLDTKTF